MTPTKKIIALVAAIFLHAAALFLFYLNQQDRSHFLSALWSGGKSGGATVTMVDITTLKEDSTFSQSDEIADSGAMTTTGGVPVVKTKTGHQKKKADKTKNVTGQGEGSSDTPAGGVGSGLDKSGVISDTAPSVLAQIRKKIMRKKVYPLHAQENNITGKVSVAFQINEDGSLKLVTVQKSSGSSELDEAAMAAIKKAAPLPYYPAVIALTMEYHLERE